MRITFILAVVCLGFVACNKEYSCDCTVGGNADSVRNFPVAAAKKSIAKEKCIKYQNDVNTVNLGTANPTISCVVK